MAQRIYLGMMAALYFASALYAYLDPAALGEWLGIASLTDSGHTEIRATYGGLVLGSGLVLAAGVWSKNFALAGLLSTVLGMGCLVLTRLAAEVFSGAPGINANQGIVIVFEGIAAALAVLFARRALRENRNLADSRY